MQTQADPLQPHPLNFLGSGPPSARAAGAFAAITLAYAVFALLGMRWALAYGAASPVWPAAGIALAALVLRGPRQWPAIALGYLLAAWIEQPPHAVWVLLVIALGNAVAPALAAWALQRAEFNSGFERSRDVVLFMACAALSALISTTSGALAVVQSISLDAPSAEWTWINWYLGDLSGVLVVASLVLAWTHGRLPRSRRWWLQFAGCVTLAGLVAALVFLAQGTERRFTFLAFLPLIWAALSLRLRGATVMTLLVAASAIWGATVGLGPFAYPGFAARFVDVQIFVAIISTVTLTLAVVADERRAQKALTLSEARLRLALEASHTGLWKLDIRSGAMTFSPECGRVTGLSAYDVDGSRAGVMSVIHADDQAAVRAAFWDAVQHGRLLEAVFRIVHPSGRLVWIEARGRAMFDANGQPESMLGTITDITERKRDERQLADQARLLDLTTDAIIIRDPRGHISYWNDGAVEMYGYSREEATGRVVRELLQSDFAEPLERIEETLLKTDRWAGELSHVARDGRTVCVHARWVLNRDVLGKPVSVLQTHTDITARKRVESNARFLTDLDRAIAQASSADAIAEAGLAMLGRHLRLMRCTLSDIDLARGRIRTLHEWTDGAPKVSGAFDARDFFMSEFGALLASGEAVAIADLRKDPLTAEYASNYHPYGTVALAAASYVTEGRLAGTLTVAVGHPRPWRADETQLLREAVMRLWPAIERAKAVAALRESEARFRQMADTAPMMIWVTEPDGACSYVSRRWLEFTGRRVEEELAMGWTELVHPDERDALLRALVATSERQQTFSGEFRALRWDGAYRWLLATGRPRADAAGRFLGLIGASMDITERKEAEQALHEADRRKDEFLATLAHELRNPLSPIRTGLQVLNLTDDADTARRTRQMMERQLGHMVRLIDDLLDVSRITSGKVVLQRGRIPLQDAARAAVESTRPLIEAARHRLALDLPAEPLWVDADPTRLTQVLGNLLTNAAKYTPDAGDIRLEASRVGDQARISVRDTGLGIPPDALGDVFGMFAQVNRTLDRAQGGLGIGLALARRLIEMHGGTITAESEGLGRGSLFTVTLPLAIDAPRAPADDHEPAPAAPKQRVLVVDDNRDAAESLAMMLRLEGHETRSVTGGAEALDAVAGFRPGVVFLDIGMPGMNGHEVARRLRADDRFGALYLIAASGWGGESDKRLAREAGFDLHLTKPVSVETVRRVLAEAGRRDSTQVDRESAPG